VTLLDLTAAYGVIANDGRAVRPYGIAAIVDRRGRTLYRRATPAPEELVDARTARRMDAMMQRVVQVGTGRAARLDRPAAGKTGTSSDFRDAWFIGYSGDLICGVWVGNDDGSPMKSVTGGNVPAQVWHDFMMAARASGVGDRAAR
jgi:penicillin-binding protein 1A